MGLDLGSPQKTIAMERAAGRLVTIRKLWLTHLPDGVRQVLANLSPDYFRPGQMYVGDAGPRAWLQLAVRLGGPGSQRAPGRACTR